MNSSAGLKNFLKDNFSLLLLAAVIFCAVFFGAAHLAARPKIWVDEALTIELARNFLNFGTLNIQTAPGRFFAYPHLLQSTGYPLTIFLALVFKVFGYSFLAGRIAMLAITALALAAAWLFSDKFFGRRYAALSLVLVASFSSFYASGLTAVGEILGFIFLLAAVYLLLIRNEPYRSGLFLGLAVVTKPSVFLLALPVFVLIIFLARENFFKKIFEFGASSFLPVALWIFLVVGNPFSAGIWGGILNFYKNPYGQGSVSANILVNLRGFFHSETLVYFGFLFLTVCLARHFQEEKRFKLFYDFVIAYGILAFIYYLKSPGWLRYILIAELLILLILPQALRSISKKIFAANEWPAALAVLFLCAVQLFHLLTGSQIYTSDSALQTAELINDRFPSASVGVMDAIEMSALIKTRQKYQTFELMGIPQIGDNFLLAGSLPEVLVFPSGRNLSNREQDILKSRYISFLAANGYEVYVLSSMQK